MSWHKSTMTSSRNALLRLLLLGLVCSNQQVAAFFQAFQGKPTPAAPKVKIPANFVVPEPKPLSITRVEGVPDLISSSAALALRFASGVFCVGWKPTFSLAREDVGGDDEYSLKLGPLVLKDTSELIPTLNRPTKTLVLYEYEGSPYCRLVREACSMLDLEVEIRPCPQGASATRAALLKEGSKVQVPYLKDPNNSPVVGMYESSDIIEYLFENYGPGKEAIPWTLAMRGLAVQTSAAATVARKLGGCKRDIRANPNNHKMKPLELWCYQGSPFVAAVREKLTELELPHKIVFCARGSSNRKKLVALTGSQFQIPWIKDPNTGVEMFESFEIAEYLDAVYRIDA